MSFREKSAWISLLLYLCIATISYPGADVSSETGSFCVKDAKLVSDLLQPHSHPVEASRGIIGEPAVDQPEEGDFLSLCDELLRQVIRDGAVLIETCDAIRPVWSHLADEFQVIARALFHTFDIPKGFGVA